MDDMNAMDMNAMIGRRGGSNNEVWLTGVFILR